MAGALAASLAGAAHAQEAPKPAAPWEGELQQEVFTSRPRGALESAVESYTKVAGTYEGLQATLAVKRLPGSVQEGFALKAKPGLLPFGFEARAYRSGEIGGEFGEGGKLALSIPLNALKEVTLLADGREEAAGKDRVHDAGLGIRIKAEGGLGSEYDGWTFKVGDAELNGESFQRGWFRYIGESPVGTDQVLAVSAGVNEVPLAGKSAEVSHGMVALWPKDLKDDRDAWRVVFNRNPQAQSWDAGLFYAIDATALPQPLIACEDNGFYDGPKVVGTPLEYFVRHLNEGDWRARVAVVTAKYAQAGEDRDLSAGGVLYPGPALGKDWGALDGLYVGGRAHATETAGQRDLKFVGELGYNLGLGNGSALRFNLEKEESGPVQAVLSLELKF